MKCSYYNRVLEFDEFSSSIQDKEDILKHISSCEGCKELYNMLSLSKKYSSEEYELRNDFYKQVLNSVDSSKYKHKSVGLSLCSLYEKLKPVIKPAFAGVAVIAAFVFVFAYGGQILQYLNTELNPSEDHKYGSGISQLRTNGQNIVTKDGKPIMLKGICLTNNVWGSWVDGVSEQLQDEGKNPLIRPAVQDSWVLTDEDFKIIESMEINNVRYDINYELFTEDNPNRDSNIIKLKEDIKRFASMDIYTVLFMSIVPGIDPLNDTSQNLMPAENRLKSVFEDEKYFNEWKEIWKYLAKQLKDTRGVAGYEIIGVPRVPSDEDGGLEIFRNRLNEVCKAVREIDRDHILFIPEYHSREANPGEEYLDLNSNNKVIDSGEQGIIWESGFVKVDVPNVVYAFQFFDPYEFTFNGTGNYNPEDLELSLENRVDWAVNAGNAPLIARYGIARINSPVQRVSWLQTVHSIFKRHKISSSYYEYKNIVGSYNMCKRGYFGIYGVYTNWKKEIGLTSNGYAFYNEGIRYSADSNDFTELLDKYFFKSGKIETTSVMDNEPILNILKEYWK